MQIDELYGIYLLHPVISTDTRKIVPGCIFFALKGENFNANTFAASAIGLGAAYAIVDEPDHKAGDACILVTDVLQTLQELAKYHRSKLNIPFIGITGTNGKTTTKELIAAVLGEKYAVLATKGNLNNHIGVPLTILAITADIEIAVIEMGANHQGEIAFLCSIAQPTHGLITNVGKAHLEGFGGFEGVKKTKAELYEYLARHERIVFLNAANRLLSEMLDPFDAREVISYNAPAGITGGILSADPYLELNWQSQDMNGHIHTRLTGTYNLDNILAAICIGHYFKLGSEQIVAGIENYSPANNRSQILDTGRNRLICDYYNANPSSMDVALDNLEAIQAGHKVMILGDMFELGDETEHEHEMIVRRAGGIRADRKIFIGAYFYACKRSGSEFFRTAEEAITALKEVPVKGSTILLKGSRGMKLETLVEFL